jgi:hypothetical protein
MKAPLSTVLTSATRCLASRRKPARRTRFWSIYWSDCDQGASHSGPGRAQVAAGAKTVDRADSRHHEASHRWLRSSDRTRLKPGGEGNQMYLRCDFAAGRPYCRCGLRHGPGDGQGLFRGILCTTPFSNRFSVVTLSRTRLTVTHLTTG